MPKSSSSGFTKAANKQKFVRNRDIKLKSCEAKYEVKIQKLMAEGICRRCREKVQWRFKYDKYKPLKAPGTCQDCKHKTITKAYRSLCDNCASIRQVCPSCCSEFSLLNEQDELINSTQNADKNEGKMMEESNTEEKADDYDDEDEYELGMMKEDDDNSTEGMEVLQQHDQDTTESNEISANAWDERKYTQYASQKYSKSRIVGNETDAINIASTTKLSGDT